jgi:hypothetical protein
MKEAAAPGDQPEPTASECFGQPKLVRYFFPAALAHKCLRRELYLLSRDLCQDRQAVLDFQLLDLTVPQLSTEPKEYAPCRMQRVIALCATFLWRLLLRAVTVAVH